MGISRTRRITRVAVILLLGVLALFGLGLIAARVSASLRENATDVPATTRLVATPLGRVAMALSGPESGPPILLVHGTAAWSGFWRDVATHLAARGWRVIAIDLPPFGYSDRDPQARYDRASQAARLSSVLLKVAGSRAVVVGHSFGAGAATELALLHPRQLRSLVLVDAALGAFDPLTAEPGAAESEAVHRALRTPWLAEPVTAATVTNPIATGPLLRSLIARKDSAAPWLGTLRQPMRRAGTTAGYAAWLPALFAADDGARSRRSGELARIAVPVSIIWGAADTVTPVAQGETIARLTRARSFARLPGVGHIPHIEDPAGFLAALDAAIDTDRRMADWETSK